jgi:hypothetical protein
MYTTLASDVIDFWALGVAVVAALIAIIALYQNSQARSIAEQANKIAMGQNLLTQQAVEASRQAVEKADEANAISQQALEHHKQQSEVNLKVEPKMVRFISSDRSASDDEPRPMVTITNLSPFPVRVNLVWFKTANGDPLLWNQPSASSATGGLPATVSPRTSLAVYGTPGVVKPETIAEVVSAVVRTDCGAVVEGAIDPASWGKYAADIKAKPSTQG